MQHCGRNLFNSEITDPVKYSKWPLALITHGKKEEARHILACINKIAWLKMAIMLQPIGIPQRVSYVFHTLDDTATIELGDPELVEKQLGIILQYHNKTTGGLATFPSKQEKITEDRISTALLGWAGRDLKNRELANSILPFFEKLSNQKIENNKFWLRIAPDGSRIKQFLKIPNRKSRNTSNTKKSKNV